MAENKKIIKPDGDQIIFDANGIKVPERPIIPYIRGDGIGPEIWEATRQVLDVAVQRAYGTRRSIAWLEVYAGIGAVARYGENVLLPDDTLDAIRRYKVAIKGPLATPVGGGTRSTNVALRQKLDLYANVRPVNYLPGLPSPLKTPEKVNVVIFRENLEDVYAGYEWPAESAEARQIIDLINNRFSPERDPLSEKAAIGIKPVTRRGCERLVRAAINYARMKKRASVTLVHKGNIMKFTEGAFRQWGYALAREEFGQLTITEQEVAEQFNGRAPQGKIVIQDRIADAMFQELILRPEQHAVIATTNLNGDYLSDAAASLVGGLGFAAGANFGDELALFEAVHGTVPHLAGQNIANPSSLILSGTEMLQHLGWGEAADLICDALPKLIARNQVTADVARWLPGVVPLSCSAFADKLKNVIQSS